MGRLAPIGFIIWQGGSILTFAFLTFFDHHSYTWWNWLIVVPLNAFLAEIWPIYWVILRPVFGA